MPRPKPAATQTSPPDPPSGPELVDEMIAQFGPKLARKSWSGMSPADVPAGKALLAADIETRAAAFGAVLVRLADWNREYTAYEARWKGRETARRRAEWDALFDRRRMLVDTLIHLRQPRLTLTDRIATRFVEWRILENGGFGPYGCHVEWVWDMIRPHAAANAVGPYLRKAIGRLIRQLRQSGFVKELKFADKFEELLAKRR